ncbi:MAG: VC0807 family protein [Aestuariibacter sp.]
MTESTRTTTKPKKQGGFFSNLIFNIIIPTVILTQFSDEESLGPAYGIVVALAFPICFGIWDLIKAGKINPFSVIGIISVGLTGGISLLQLDPEYIAIKEAAIPGMIGLAVLFSNKTRFPLVKKLILNEQMINIPALNAALEEKGNVARFEQRVTTSSLIVASSFFLSSALNYILAKVLLVSPPGTSAYNEELGKMTAMSYPVIVVPSMIVLFLALWYLFSQMGKLTGQSIENFINEQ